MVCLDKFSLVCSVIKVIVLNLHLVFTHWWVLLLNTKKMAITRLKRKDRKNKARANNKTAFIKQYRKQPVLKSVDVEAIKAEFEAAKTGKPAAKKTAKAVKAEEEE